jgi:CDP-diacylglycerol--serine O-phosphatidyltransferase
VKRAVPSLVTLSAVLCALLAVLWASWKPYWACNAIIAASLLDMIDGRVARMLDAQTEIGAQLDSLADVIAFGVAPALLVYFWAAPLYQVVPGIDVSVVVSFAFVGCAALRLARFNLDSDSSPKKHFEGIPTPVAALSVTTLVMAYHELELELLRHPALVLGMAGVAAVLMVAPIPFPSFKSFKRRWTAILYFGSMLGGLTMLFLRLPGGAVLLALILFYIVRGLVLAAVGKTG